MATPVVFNGVNYSVPAFGDVGYAQGPGNLSSYLIAIASGTLQATGGLFSLTADANFGPNFGLVSIYYKSASANIAQSGVLRLANTDTIAWRNFANTLDLPLAVNASDQLTFNGVVISTAAAGGTVNTGVAGRLTLYPAAGNTVDDIYVQNAQNIDVLIAPQAARSVALEYTIPNPGNAVAAATFALLELAQTFTATQTFAAATFTGLITGVSATLSGVLTLSATTNQIVLGTTNTTTINSVAPSASRVYTIPDAGAAASFVMTESAQTLNGIKTFSAEIISNTGATSLANRISLTETSAQQFYIATNDAASTGQVILSINRNPVTGTFAKTGQAASFIQFDSATGAGSITVRASATNNTTPEVVASFLRGGVTIRGTNTNDAAASGFVGETVSSLAGPVSAAASNTWGDITSISLTAGDWDICCAIYYTASGATVTLVNGGIGDVAGNSASGLSPADTLASTAVPTSTLDQSIAIPQRRYALAGSVTLYLKSKQVFTVATPTAYGRLSARRVR